MFGKRRNSDFDAFAVAMTLCWHGVVLYFELRFADGEGDRNRDGNCVEIW